MTNLEVEVKLRKSTVMTEYLRSCMPATMTARYRKGPLSQMAAIAIVMYKLLYPSIRVRTAPPVSVRVRTRVSVSFSLRILICMCGSLR